MPIPRITLFSLVPRRCRRLGNGSIFFVATTLICVFLIIIDNLPDQDLEEEKPAAMENQKGGNAQSGNTKLKATQKTMNKKILDTLLDQQDTPAKVPPLPTFWLDMVEDIRSNWLVGRVSIKKDIHTGLQSTIAKNSTKTITKRRRRPDFRDISRHGEAKVIDELLEHRRGGFFVEAGAGDGRTYSGTLFMEQNRGWSGVLVEPDAESFKVMNEFSGRRSARLKACLSPSGLAGTWQYIGDLEGFDLAVERRLEAYIPWVTPIDSVLNVPHSGYSVEVQCFPLAGILLALRRLRVDFWYLDAGAAEVDILRTAVLDVFLYDVIAINVWAGSEDETSENLAKVKKIFADRFYRPVKLLPKNWKQLEAALLIVQRITLTYPVRPGSLPPVQNRNVSAANVSPTMPTPSNQSLRIEQLLHLPPKQPQRDLEQWTISPMKRDANESKNITNPAIGSIVPPIQTGSALKEVFGRLTFRETFLNLLFPLFTDVIGGFFVESMASEGQLTSTTFHLEKLLGWTGVLLEPDPDFFSQLLAKQRRAYALNACLRLSGNANATERTRRAFKRASDLTPGGRVIHTADGADCSSSSTDSSSASVCVDCIALDELPEVTKRSGVDFLSLQLDDLTSDSIAQLPNLRKLGVKALSVEHPIDNQAKVNPAQTKRPPALIAELDKALKEQSFNQVGSVTDDRHLLTTIILYAPSA